MRLTLFILLILSTPSLIAFSPATALAQTRMMVTESLQRLSVDATPTHLPSKTQYLTLESRYESAKGLEIKDVKGWHAGRCFFKDSPSRAVATLLAADSIGRTNSNGPLFQNNESRHITPLINTKSIPDFFDSLEASKTTLITKVIDSSRELNAYPVRSNEELVIAGHRTVDLQSRAYRIRKSGRYLILKLECAERSFCTNINGWNSNRFLAWETEPVAYCYYFKKVKP